MKFNVTSREFHKKNGICPQRAYELRNGQRKKRKDGTVYQQVPILKKGRDYIFKEGKLYYRDDLTYEISNRGRRKCK